MKAYKFQFENVLKSKQIIVDQLASKTARARKIQLLEERKLDDLRERQSGLVRQLLVLKTGNVDTMEVQRCYGYLELLGDAISEQTHTIKEIASRVEMLRSMLAEAEKERKIFEKLDEKEREQFNAEFKKKEQAALDEVGVNRFVQRSAYERFHSPAS